MTDLSNIAEVSPPMPWQAQAYLRRIEALAGVPIRYISVGPERDQLIVI